MGLLQDLHFNGCDGLVALPGGFEASPRHCVGLPVLIALFRVLCLLRQAYKVLQSSYFFHFVVTYSARLIFHFCVADLIATQIVPTQPYHCLDEGNTFKTSGHLYFERVLFIPSEASRECLTCFFNLKKKKKKNIILNPNFKLIKYKFFHSFNLG